MIRNYFKIALRNLLKYKFISFINLFGLTVGLTCCLLITTYVLNELSYDRYNKNADNVYCVIRSFNNQDGVVSLTLGTVAPPFGYYLPGDFPEIKKTTRMLDNGITPLRYKEKLLNEFEKLSEYLSQADHKYFMFRDFQSRNILINDEKIYFIDYQGGMKGALQYDVASMLWQAKANLSDEWKNNLLDYYMDCVDEILNKKIDRTGFVNRYNGYVLIRLMQVLGAYGFRGLFERKAHFLTSIPLALKNLKYFMDNQRVRLVLPEFERMLNIIVQDEMIERFQPAQANENTPLLVSVKSFSTLATVNGGERCRTTLHGA